VITTEDYTFLQFTPHLVSAVPWPIGTSVFSICISLILVWFPRKHPRAIRFPAEVHEEGLMNVQFQKPVFILKKKLIKEIGQGF